MTLIAVGGRRRTPLPTPPYNASTYLAIPTPEGSGVCLHPDVIDFGPVGWNGWRFWMAFTPLPTEADENPCIVVSADGLTWQVPPGGSNPIDPTPATGYNSDATLAYHAGTLYCVWRERPANLDEIMWISTSTNGTTWTTPVKTFHAYGTGGLHLSPSIIRDGAGWRIYLKRGDLNNECEYFTADNLTDSWGSPTIFTLPGTRKTLNHLTVTHAGGRYYLAGHTSWDDNTITAWTSTDLTTWTEGADILATAASGWDSGKLYRCAMAPHEDGRTMRVWYSGSGAVGWRIGYTRVPLAAFLA